MSELAPSVGGGATTDRSQLSLATGVATETLAAQLIRGIVKASRQLDPLGLQNKLDLALAALGLARCVDEIVMPATRLLRGLLATGHRSADQDLLATEAIRTWLNLQGSYAPAPREHGPILFACGSRETQMVGVESLALLLRFQRRPCQVLGARISTFTLKIAAQAAGAVGVVVTSNDNRGLPRAVVLLRAVDELDIPVFYLGDSFESKSGRAELPGRYLGTSIRGACSSLIDAMAGAS